MYSPPPLSLNCGLEAAFTFRSKGIGHNVMYTFFPSCTSSLEMAIMIHKLTRRMIHTCTARDVVLRMVGWIWLSELGMRSTQASKDDNERGCKTIAGINNTHVLRHRLHLQRSALKLTFRGARPRGNTFPFFVPFTPH